MKRWTVMLIPHDRGGETRSLSIHSLLIWTVVTLFVVLSFSTAFLFQRYRVTTKRAADLEHANAQFDHTHRASADALGTQTTQARDDIDQLRAYYEQRERVITEELAALYDLEKDIRELQGFAPRVQRAAGFVAGAPEEEAKTSEGKGKGGPPGRLGGAAATAVNRAAFLPPQVIYGLARPSSDLISFESKLRAESLVDLLKDMQDYREKLACKPATWPIRSSKQHITSRFGRRRDPFTGKPDYHSGIDIGGQRGTPILATGKGKVIFAGRDGYYGNVVRIDHGYGYVTVYAHLTKTTVKEGDRVTRGEQVGTLGSTGRSTGNHVHYEVKVNGKAVNPDDYLKD